MGLDKSASNLTVFICDCHVSVQILQRSSKTYAFRHMRIREVRLVPVVDLCLSFAIWALIFELKRQIIIVRAIGWIQRRIIFLVVLWFTLYLFSISTVYSASALRPILILHLINLLGGLSRNLGSGGTHGRSLRPIGRLEVRFSAVKRMILG